MFDLLEENLAIEVQPKQQTVTPEPESTLDTVVFAMPEKFRTQEKKTSPLIPILMGVVGLLIIGAIAAIAYVMIKGQKQAVAQVTAAQQVATSSLNTTTVPSSAATTTPESVLAPVINTPVSQDPSLSIPPIPSGASSTPQGTAVMGQYALGIDSDGDGLTDAEEKLFGTGSLKPDTDEDGHVDGEELKRLFDPTRPQGAMLEGSGLTNQYTNRTFGYTIQYPSTWVAGKVNASENDALINAPTGEFVSIQVKDNVEGLTAIDWYSKVVVPGVETQKVITAHGDTWDAALSEDNLTVYLTKKGPLPKNSKPVTIIITYNLNTKNELNFLTTFQTMVQSFVFSDLSFVKK